MSTIESSKSRDDVFVAVNTQQVAMFVGKIPAAGVWGALDGIVKADSIRNGVMIVFSDVCSGQIGIFCNRYLTGALIDGTGEQGLPALKKLLGLRGGVFCFRPCLGNESDDLGQSVSLDIHELLLARPDNGTAASATSAIATMSYAGTDDYLGEVSEFPVDSALVISSSPAQYESDVSEKQAPAAEERPVTADTGTQDESGHIDYLDWFDKQDDSSLNLRRILLPVFTKTGTQVDTRMQAQRDLETYRKFLQEEEVQIRSDIERQSEPAAASPVADKTLKDMELLAGMLQSQEKSIASRWDGLDQIATPKSVQSTHIDGAGAMIAGAPLRSSKEFLAGCEDLVSVTTKAIDPKEFFKGVRHEGLDQQPFWMLNRMQNPKVLWGVLISVFVALMLAVNATLHTSMINGVLKEGKENLFEQNWSGAIVLFTDAIAKDPNNAQSYYLRGMAYAENGDSKEATADFKKAMQLGMHKQVVLMAQASIALRNEDWTEAFDLASQAITSEPSAAAFRLRATSSLHLNDLASAIKDYDTALSLAKDDKQLAADIHADRGYAEIQAGQSKEGVADFEATLKVNRSKAIYMLRGDAYRKTKQYDLAIADYSSALQLDPRNYDAYVARGICEAAMHRDESAFKDFGRALEIDQNGVEALIQRGSLRLARGAHRLALDDLELAQELNPTVEETRQKLMLAYGQEKREVPKSLLQAENRQSERRKLPSNPQQLVVIGYNDLQQDDLDGAIDALVEAVKKAPNNASARRYLAFAFQKVGDFRGAASQFKALSALQNLSDEDSLAYGDVLERAGDDRGAVAVLNYCLSAHPDNNQARLKLTRLYYRAGERLQGDQLVQQGIAHAANAGEREQFIELMHVGGAAQQFNAKPTTGTHG